MPKRMRDQVVRDRAAALAIESRRNAFNAMNAPATIEDAGAFGLPDAEPYDDVGDFDEANEATNLIGITELGRALPSNTQRPVDKKIRGAHQIDEAELGDFDLDAMFAAMTQEAPTIIPPEVRARNAPSVPPPAPPPSSSSTRMRQASMPPPLPPPRSKTPTPLGDKTSMDIPACTARTASDSWSKAPPPAIPRRIPSVDPSAMPPPAQRPAPFTRAAAPAQPRATTPSPVSGAPKRPSTPDMSPPAGMSEADVRSLYDKYSKAREMVGEKNDDATYQKLLRTIRAQAPKIMEQYKAQGVEFGVVIKDNQVILKAKPKP